VQLIHVSKQQSIQEIFDDKYLLLELYASETEWKAH